MDRARIERLEALLAKVPEGRWEVEDGGLNEWGQREYHLRMTDGPLEITEAATFYGDPHDINLACAAVNALPSLLRLARAVADAPKGEVWQHTMLGGQRQTHVVITREAGDGLASMGPVILLRADAADTTAGEDP